MGDAENWLTLCKVGSTAAGAYAGVSAPSTSVDASWLGSSCACLGSLGPARGQVSDLSRQCSIFFYDDMSELTSLRLTL